MEEALLKNFPTQYFASNIVLISGAPRGRDDMRSGKERVETFFHESSIEKIEIQNVGMKNSKDIHLLGF